MQTLSRGFWRQGTKMELKNVLGSSKTFKVLLTRYPEEFTVHAENKESALAIAKGRANFCVWESEVEEVDN